MRALDDADRRLLAEFQRELPLVPDPYAEMARRLGLAEDDVLARLEALQRDGFVSRVGAVFTPHRVGASTLAAMAVPPHWLDRIADLVSSYPEVNHNYQREHRLNLWFVVAAAGRDEVSAVLADIARRTGIEVLDLPLVEDFHIDLGFDIRWS